MVGAVQQQRLMSLDAFRGLTIAGMILVNNPGDWGNIYAPLRHAEWHGCTPTDLVFPFFLFIVGVALVFAFARQREAGVDRGGLTLRALRRGIVLVTLGLFIAGFRKHDLLAQGIATASLAVTGWLALRLRGNWRELALCAIWLAYAGFELTGPGIRIPGVLQRIGVCFFLASVVYLWLPRRALPWFTALLLLGYWPLLVWTPIPGHGLGSIDDPVNNIASYLDRLLLEGHLWLPGKRDPEGPLHTITALGTTLLGVFAGELLRSDGTAEQRTLRLLLRGCALALLGYLWSWALPLNKPLWTSSYVLVTGGVATLGLGIAYWLVDVQGWRRAAAPLVTYGLNAITVFVGSAAVSRVLQSVHVDERTTLPRFVYLRLADILPLHLASLAFALLWVSAWYGVLRVMQARGWVIRV
jgi:predicted acyltransferase